MFDLQIVKVEWYSRRRCLSLPTILVALSVIDFEERQFWALQVFCPRLV